MGSSSGTLGLSVGFDWDQKGSWRARALHVLPHAPGDVHGGPSDVARPVARQEHHYAGHLIGAAKPAKGNLLLGHPAEEFFFGNVGGASAVNVLPLRSDHEARVHAVHEDVSGASWIANVLVN